MTTTTITRLELAMSELAEHLERITRLEREPFTADRIAMHRGNALECLDELASLINGECG